MYNSVLFYCLVFIAYFAVLYLFALKLKLFQIFDLLDYVFLGSYTVHDLYVLAKKTEDYTESIKAFYEMKYGYYSSAIKGLGALIIASLSTVAEDFIKGKELSSNGKDILFMSGLVLITIFIFVTYSRQTIMEYKKAITIYSILK